MTIKSFVLTAVVAIPLLASAEPDGTKTAPPPGESKKPDTAKDAPAPDTVKPRGSLSDEEVRIVAHLHHVNVMEIDLGKVAKARGTAAVKRYGEVLVRDHETADKELVVLAKQKGLAKIPAVKRETEADKAEHQKMRDDVAKLKKLRRADFDREYLRMMVEGHEKELAKSDVFLASATDPDLKTLLEARKISLQRHADTARELQKGNAQASVTPKQTAPVR